MQTYIFDRKIEACVKVVAALRDYTVAPKLVDALIGIGQLLHLVLLAVHARLRDRWRNYLETLKLREIEVAKVGE